MPSDTNLTAKRDDKGHFIKGSKPTNGFDKRPQDRSNGSWKKELTPRYILEQIMQKSERELKKLLSDTTCPVFQRTMAEVMLDEKMDSYKKWSVLRGMIDQVYGRPALTVTPAEQSEKKPFVVGYALPFLEE